MAKITKEVVSDIANLARIEMSETEREKIAKTFAPIMEMIDQVNEIELDDNIQRDFSLRNVMREDQLRDDTSENREEVLREFPETKDNYLKSKKIL